MKSIIIKSFFGLSLIAVLNSCNSGNSTTSIPNSSVVMSSSSSAISFLGNGMTEEQFNALDRVGCEFYSASNPDSVFICATYLLENDSIREFAPMSCTGFVHSMNGDLDTLTKNRLVTECKGSPVANCQIPFMGTNISIDYYILEDGQSDSLGANCTVVTN